MAEISPREESGDSIRYLSQLNFSIFTQLLGEVSRKNRPRDDHGKLRKNWLKITRNLIRARSMQTVIIFLYAAKAHTLSTQHTLKFSFQKWKEGVQRRRKIRQKWQYINGLIISIIHQNRLSEYREKVYNQRCYLTSRYLTSLPKISNPDYDFFFKQINNNQLDENPAKKQQKSKADQHSASEQGKSANTQSEGDFFKVDKVKEREAIFVEENIKDESDHNNENNDSIESNYYTENDNSNESNENIHYNINNDNNYNESKNINDNTNNKK